MAGLTGLEPATSGVTGRRCNRLYYSPAEENRKQKIGEFVLQEGGYFPFPNFLKQKPAERSGYPKLLYSVFQSFASLKLGSLGGGNLNLLTSLGVLTGTGSALADAEGTETDEGDLLTSLQGLCHGIDKALESLLCISLAQPRLFRHRINKVRFSHNIPPN